MSITVVTFIGALAILVGSLMGALATGWVQHRFWKHQERQKTRLTIADKIAQFYADLPFNWNLEHSSTDDDRKREAGWRREVVSACWWKKPKASSSSELAQRLALAGRRAKEDDAHGKG